MSCVTLIKRETGHLWFPRWFGAALARCPSLFAIFWRLVEPFVPPATVKKIRIKGYACKSFVGEMKVPNGS